MNITKEDIDKLVDIYKKEKLNNAYIQFRVPIKYFKKNGIDIPKEYKDNEYSVPLYRNLLTGYVQTDKPINNARISIPWYYSDIWTSCANRKEQYYDITYFENVNMLGIVFYDYTVISKKIKINDYEKFKGKVTKIVFIDKNKETSICNLNKNEKAAKDMPISIIPLDISRTIGYHTQIGCICWEPYLDANDYWKIETSKLFPHAFFGGNNYMYIQNINVLTQYMKRTPLKISSSSKQKKIDDLCSLPLPDIDIDDLRKNPVPITIIANKVKDGLAVLRWINYNKYIDTFCETSRLYIQKNENILCRKDITEDFIYIRSNLTPSSFKCDAFVIKDKDCFKDTSVEYFTEALKEVHTQNSALLLETFLNYPIAEKMWRIDLYKKLVLKYFNTSDWNSSNSFNTYLENICKFGSCDLKAKNPQKALGLSKCQIESLKQFTDSINTNLYKNVCFVKDYFGMNDVSSIDNETFDKLCSIPDAFIKDIVIQIKQIYSSKTAISMIGPLKTLFDKNEWNAFYLYLKKYEDYIIMVSVLNDTKNFRPQFSSEEDIVEMHDAIIPIFNLRKHDARESAFKKRLDKWNEWNYNKNETFISINPTVPAELANEGLALHHCVKSYIDRVAEGRTNIMFIRKKEEPEKPFFTVEISDDGMIEQVHGFSNRNAETEPGLEKYIKEWAKNCKLKLSNFNKIR